MNKKRWAISFIATLIVLIVLVLGYCFADKFKIEKQEENTEKVTINQEEKTDNETKMESFTVYVVGETPFGDEDQITYKSVKENELKSLEDKAIVLVKKQSFQTNPKLYKEIVENGKSVLVYENKIDIDSIVLEFGIDIKKAGIESGDDVIYQGYGYANIKGKVMPIFVAASKGVTEIGEKSFVELFKEIKKENKVEE